MWNNGLKRKLMININIYDFLDWETNNYNIRITQYLNHTMTFDQLIEYNMKTFCIIL